MQCRRNRSNVLFAGVLWLVSGRPQAKGQILVGPLFSPSILDGHDHGRGSRDVDAAVADVRGHGGAHDGHEDSHDGHTAADGAQGHGDSHGGHTGARGHASSSSVSKDVAVVLFGTVGWVMSLFYFVNWPDKDVRQATWDMLSDMICIFSAVLMFAATRQVMMELAGEKPSGRHDPPDMKSLGLSAVRFVLMMVFVQALFWTNRTTYWTLKYAVNIGGHVVGFAAIDLFGSMLQLPMLSQDIMYSVIAVVVICVVIACVFHPPHLFRTCFAEERHFHDECSEAETESIGLCLGLLVSMVIRFAITGHMPPVHGTPLEKSAAEVGALFLCASLLCPCVMLASVAHHQLPDTASLTQRTFLETLKETLSMSVGWCFLFWGNWLFFVATDDQHVGSGGMMKTKIMIALLFVVVSFAAILSIDAIADRSGPSVEAGLRALLRTVALVVGLSWEASFAEAVTSIGDNFAMPARAFVQVGLTFSLCIVVLPAWAHHILPHTSHCLDQTKEHGASKV